MPRTPFTAQEYKTRREQIARRLGPDAALLLIAPPLATRSRDTHYPYRAHSDILYLSGFAEPGSALLITPGHDAGEFALFTRRRDPAREQWDGIRAGAEGAVNDFGADVAYPIDELEEHLSEHLSGRRDLYYELGQETDAMVLRVLDKLQNRRKPPGHPVALHTPAQVIHPIRARKSAAEIELIQRACEITSDAHILAMRRAKPDMFEYELQALIEYTFMSRGASAPAYASIVGAGDRANILHYIENDRRAEDGDLVLIDAGCELQGYAADITRTFPVNGSFTSAQRDVYQAVLEIQLVTIEAIREGVRFAELNDIANRLTTQALIDLGLLRGSVDELIETNAFRKYYPHSIGHWMGIDVHDVGPYNDGDDSIALAPGMILTIEPGIYIPSSSDAPEHLRGIGVRIEDDILITSDGVENLTRSCPKTLQELEELVGSASA